MVFVLDSTITSHVAVSHCRGGRGQAFCWEEVRAAETQAKHRRRLHTPPARACSTFFNAVTDGAHAKTGNYPFTTIDPNRSVTYFRHPCPCADVPGLVCTPKHGRCEGGVRHTPVELLDVAGLIPGASAGAGLGNKFLNDLCGAKALIHVIDVSGRTNEKGEATSGHDPSADVLWLHQEIQDWIHGNVTAKWGNMTRKHAAKVAHSSAGGAPTVPESLNLLFSGYGANASLMLTALKVCGLPHNADICSWDDAAIRRFVAAFQALRFPTLLFLNKADVAAPDTDRNISRITKQFGSAVCHVGSAAAECFLRREAARGMLEYPELGGETVRLTAAGEADGKVPRKVTKLQERMMERFGGTGVWDVVQAAVSMTKPVPVFPVTAFPSTAAGPAPRPANSAATASTAAAAAAGGAEADSHKAVYPTCLLLPSGSTVRSVARALSAEMAAGLTHAEGPDGKAISAHWPVPYTPEGKPVVLKLHIDKKKAASVMAGWAADRGEQ